MQLQGNTIFITGGGSGIGRGLAEAFHRLGNRVIIAGRRREVLEGAASENPGMATMQLDTSNRDSIRAGATEAIRRFPDIDVVINNAGVQRVIDFARDEPIDEAAFEEEVDTNIYGVLRVTSAFLPHLKTRPSATIINVSSGLAFMPIARFPVYCATKAFLHSFSMSLRHQLRGSSIRVIELAPPWVSTDLDATHPARTLHEGMRPMPLPDFIAAAMQDLASDRDELPVAGAKYLYSAGVSDQAAAKFDEINR
jgi:uncharacterized oxidoreductase